MCIKSLLLTDLSLYKYESLLPSRATTIESGSNKVSEATERKTALKEAIPTAEKKNEKVKLTYSEQMEWKTIEEDIMLAEETVDELKEQMAVNASDYSKLAELQEQLDLAEAAVSDKWERYEYLSQFINE